MNFGTTRYSSLQPAVTISNPLPQDCAFKDWLSNSAVTCTMPAGVGRVASIVVSVGDGAGTLFGGFKYDSPVVTHINRNGPTKGGAILTIRGTNFGLVPSVLGASVGNSACLTTAWLSNTQATCQLAPGGGARLPATITTGAKDIVGTIVSVFRYDASFTEPPGGDTAKSGRADLPQPISTYYASVGEVLDIRFTALAEDDASAIVMTSWSGSSAGSFIGFEPKLTSWSEGRTARAQWTWGPMQSGQWILCTQLVGANSLISQDKVCVTVRVLNCEHLVQPGETVSSIAKTYKVSEKTVWWLNPNVPFKSNIRAGDTLKIGRTYTLKTGQDLFYLTGEYATTWYWLSKHNPKKIFLSTTKVNSKLYKTDTASYIGAEFCVVSNLEYRQAAISGS